MKQGAFEQRYRPLWARLEATLDGLESRRPRRAPGLAGFATDYQSLCHQLALARERGYSLALQDYLNALMLRAHRQLYRRRVPLWPRVAEFLTAGFPRAVRRQWRWHLTSALAFVLSAALVVALVLHDPQLVHTVIDGAGVGNLEHMYLPRFHDHYQRTHGDDLAMFGYYIYNNIGIAFRTFASGLLLGVGAIAAVLFNGSFFGAAAAHLASAGAATNFFTFVVAHSAPELTAIVLSGGAGLRLGWAVLAPGPRRRVDALRRAARETLPVMYGVFGLLTVAASIEAFWSPRPFAPEIKYAVGALCWTLLLSYLLFAGRRHGPG